MRSGDTPIASISFDEADHILHIKMKDGAEMSLENTKEHYQAIYNLIGNKKYFALVDASEPFSVSPDAWKYASLKEVILNRVAIAHYNSCLSNKLTMDLFSSVHSVSVPYKYFRTEREAREWLGSFKI